MQLKSRHFHNPCCELLSTTSLSSDDPKADLVRHFLIEPTAKGVRLKGCSTEPVFGEALNFAFHACILNGINHMYRTIIGLSPSVIYLLIHASKIQIYLNKQAKSLNDMFFILFGPQ